MESITGRRLSVNNRVTCSKKQGHFNMLTILEQHHECGSEKSVTVTQNPTEWPENKREWER
jgi:hypothetical protein